MSIDPPEGPKAPLIPDDFGVPMDPNVVPTSGFVVEDGPPDGPAEGPADGPADGPAEGRGARAQSRRSPTAVIGSKEDRRAERGSAPGHRHFRILSLLFVAAGLALIIGGYLWVQSEADPSGPVGGQVLVAVPAGSGVNQFAGVLQDKGVIGSALAFRVWVKLHGVPNLGTGDYAFNRNDSFGAVKKVLTTGPNVFSLNVLAGFTVAEIAAQVGQFPGHSQSSFASLANGGTLHSPWQPVGSTNLDGLLGTGKYRLVPGETDQQLLTEMIDRFDAQANSSNLTSGSSALGMTPYQVITVASIVQKEGVIQKNLGPVARVIQNRLAKGMALQMDSTVLYSEGRDGGRVTSSDLKMQTPYNTYLNKGLTPTPICTPSPAALQAALNPPAGSWLFFVVVESDGTEAFADTFAQQQANETIASQRGL
jgi:UPF0755 protein